MIKVMVSFRSAFLLLFKVVLFTYEKIQGMKHAWGGVQSLAKDPWSLCYWLTNIFLCNE